jgi:hypothetical protein
VGEGVYFIRNFLRVHCGYSWGAVISGIWPSWKRPVFIWIKVSPAPLCCPFLFRHFVLLWIPFCSTGALGIPTGQVRNHDLSPDYCLDRVSVASRLSLNIQVQPEVATGLSFVATLLRPLVISECFRPCHHPAGSAPREAARSDASSVSASLTRPQGPLDSLQHCGGGSLSFQLENAPAALPELWRAPHLYGGRRQGGARKVMGSKIA